LKGKSITGGISTSRSIFQKVNWHTLRRLSRTPDRHDRTPDRLIKTKEESNDIFLASDGVPPAINGLTPRVYYATFTMKTPERLIAIYERAYIDVFTLKSVKCEV
jgi:hypothetical protein